MGDEMKIGAFILSRMDSSRLPGKAMLKLNNEFSLVEFIINNVLNIKGVKPIVLTTDREVDFPIVDVSDKYSVSCYCGDLDNVSFRIVGAINQFKLDYFFRINGDSPFFDKRLFEKALKLINEKKYDLVSNLIHRTYPYGIAVELINAKKYVELYDNFVTPEYLEHPTKYLYENLNFLEYKSLINENDCSKIKLTIDTLDDYIRIKKILKIDQNFNLLSLEEKIQIIKNNKL
jgi:spore coat polysaccharide biosynthesis protein SpsF